MTSYSFFSARPVAVAPVQEWMYRREKPNAAVCLCRVRVRKRRQTCEGARLTPGFVSGRLYFGRAAAEIRFFPSKPRCVHGPSRCFNMKIACIEWRWGARDRLTRVGPIIYVSLVYTCWSHDELSWDDAHISPLDFSRRCVCVVGERGSQV